MIRVGDVVKAAAINAGVGETRIRLVLTVRRLQEVCVYFIALVQHFAQAQFLFQLIFRLDCAGEALCELVAPQRAIFSDRLKKRQ